MGFFYQFTTLNDAFAFLLEAKGLPDVASVQKRRQRTVRACILLSWIAVEDCLDVAIEDWRKTRKAFGPFKGSLQQRVSAVVQALKRNQIDEVQFAELRSIRNQLTHPKASAQEPQLTLDQAEITFGFCMATIRAFSRFPIDLQF